MIKADLHAHSTLQPYAQSFKERQTKLSKRKNSMWFYNPPRGFTNWIKRLLGFASFSQSNFTSALKGDVSIMGVSLYAPEISFFQKKLPRLFSNGLEHIIKRYSQDRIYEIESGIFDYFKDLQDQYKFLVKASEQQVGKNGHSFALAKSFKDLEQNLINKQFDIMVVLNVEGGHGLGCGYPDFFHNPISERQKERILKNVDVIKNWEHPVLYITFCHHFYNQLCGHSKSLPDAVDRVCDQKYGMDFPITDFGFKVIDRLLDQTVGHRVLVDIKHMSIAGRQHYIEYMEELRELKNQYIPIVYSHGGANGRTSYGTYPEDSKDKNLNPDDLGLFDSEILAIADSDGIIGLNMDQRVMSSKEYMQKITKRFAPIPLIKRKYIWSGIIWNNIKYIAELLDKNSHQPWEYMMLGTDFDGAINPINYFVQEKDMEDLVYYLRIHAEEYLLSTQCKLQLKNQLSASEIIEKIMYKNALRFFEENLPAE